MGSRASALILLLVLAVSAAPGQVAGATPDGHRAEGLERANQLLDGYEGRRADLDEARQLIDQALAASPDDATVLIALSRWQMLDGRINGLLYQPASVASAIESLERAVALEPKRVDAHVRLARAYVYSIVRQSKAPEQLAIAEALDPSDPTVDFAYCLVYEFSNDWSNLDRRLASASKKVRAMGKSGARFRRAIVDNRLTLHRARENYRAVSRDYEEMARLAPRSAWTRGDYAEHLLIKVGDTEKAIRKAREALSIMNYPRARWTLGVALYARWARLKSSDPAKAERALEEARDFTTDIDSVMGQALAGARRNRDLKALSVALREAGASIDAPDHKGDSALIRSIAEKDIDALGALLDAGADPNQLDFLGSPPAVLAVAHQDSRMLSVLVAHGANLDLADAGGQRPLHYAAQRGDLKLVRMLLANGADVNARGGEDWTPLMFAATNKGALDLVKLLVENGADMTVAVKGGITATDENGTTAVGLAEQTGNREVAEWLKARIIAEQAAAPRTQRPRTIRHHLLPRQHPAASSTHVG